MAERTVTLLDFTKGEVRQITQQEAAARMLAQYARGVRMTCEGALLPPAGGASPGAQT